MEYKKGDIVEFNYLYDNLLFRTDKYNILGMICTVYKNGKYKNKSY